MEELKEKPVVFSKQYALDTEEIYQYGKDTFGEAQAIKYEAFIDRITKELYYTYSMYPECKWLPTQGRIYRNIILESHLIIYRFTAKRIEVLRVLHSHSSVTKIRGARSIKV
jgi:plasmid stabilization system protein ParE